jgi:hypothetical protein
MSRDMNNKISISVGMADSGNIKFVFYDNDGHHAILPYSLDDARDLANNILMTLSLIEASGIGKA